MIQWLYHYQQFHKYTHKACFRWICYHVLVSFCSSYYLKIRMVKSSYHPNFCISFIVRKANFEFLWITKMKVNQSYLTKMVADSTYISSVNSFSFLKSPKQSKIKLETKTRSIQNLPYSSTTILILIDKTRSPFQIKLTPTKDKLAETLFICFHSACK